MCKTGDALRANDGDRLEAAGLDVRQRDGGADDAQFDPSREKRADGIQAMKDYLMPITGKIKVDRYEMIDTKVQYLGKAAVLSYQLVSHATDRRVSRRFILGGRNFGPYPLGLLVADLPTFDGMIGDDFFLKHRICIDYPGRRVVVGK